MYSNPALWFATRHFPLQNLASLRVGTTCTVIMTGEAQCLFYAEKRLGLIEARKEAESYKGTICSCTLSSTPFSAWPH